MPFAPLLLTAVGAGVSIAGGIGQAGAQKQEIQAQQRMNDLKAGRERIQQIREARIKQGQVQQGAANSGAAMSSSATTGASGVFENAYGNIQYIGYEQQSGQAISTAKQQAANAGGVADIGRGIMEIGGAFANPENQRELGSIWQNL